MDRNKPDGSGDYILWRQLIDEARKRKLPVVLITEDRKEDWIWREHGQTIGARYELRQEMQSEAGVPFLLMTVETFLIQAGNYLQVTVSPETVSQAAELPERLISETEQRYRAQLLELQERRWNLEKRISAAEREEVRLEDELSGILLRNRGEPPDEQDLTEIQDLKERLKRLRREMVATHNTRTMLLADLQMTEKTMHDFGIEPE